MHCLILYNENTRSRENGSIDIRFIADKYFIRIIGIKKTVREAETMVKYYDLSRI